MAHDHHTHDHHAHAPADFGRAFAIGIALNFGFVVIEAAYGVLGHSVALLADAGHNIGDVLGLAVAWLASELAKRAPSARFTYGLRGSSILAALFNAVFLLVAVGAISWEAILRLDTPALSPGVRIVMVADIGEQEARLGLVNDDADVAARPHRPEMRVARTLNAVELQTRGRRVHLQIERGCLGRLLLRSGQAREGGGEGGRDPELQAHTVKTFITSSPKWLMTFTAIRPVAGRRNGRETSR